MRLSIFESGFSAFMFVEDGTVTNGEDDNFKVNVHEIRAFFVLYIIHVIRILIWCWHVHGVSKPHL